MPVSQRDPENFDQPLHQALDIITQREAVDNNRWITERWSVIGVVVPAESHRTHTKRHILSTGKLDQFLWTGFSVELFRDNTESYYFNLRGEHPSVFVVCRRDEQTDELRPFLTTLSYDEAASYQEVDDEVFSVPIPDGIYEWLEHYVVATYFPEKKVKRQRKNWKEPEGRR